MNEKMKKYLLLGIIGGIFSMIGDCLLLCSNMSFGAIIIFAAWWIVLLRQRVRNMEEQSE